MLGPPHLCPVRGQAEGKSCPSSSVASGRKLSGPIRILRQVVRAEALRRHSVCCSSACRPPAPVSRARKDPLVTTVIWTGLHVPSKPLRAHHSCCQCWGGPHVPSVFLLSPCASGMPEWSPGQDERRGTLLPAHRPWPLSL